MVRKYRIYLHYDKIETDPWSPAVEAGSALEALATYHRTQGLGNRPVRIVKVDGTGELLEFILDPATGWYRAAK